MHPPPLELESLALETRIHPISRPNSKEVVEILKSPLVVAFSKKYCGSKSPEKWFDQWLEREHDVFKMSPKKAIQQKGRLWEVCLFMERATRGSN